MNASIAAAAPQSVFSYTWKLAAAGRRDVYAANVEMAAVLCPAERKPAVLAQRIGQDRPKSSAMSWKACLSSKRTSDMAASLADAFFRGQVSSRIGHSGALRPLPALEKPSILQTPAPSPDRQSTGIRPRMFEPAIALPTRAEPAHCLGSGLISLAAAA